jgi:imidazolonepropionase-like amidohydrolase
VLQRAVVIEGARIVTMDGKVIEEGSLVIQGDKIAAVGVDVTPPPLAEKVDGRGLTLTPGLIDGMSSLGRTFPVTAASASPTRRGEDAFDRYDSESFQEALSHGVTAIHISPWGPAGVCGTGAVLRLEGRLDEGPIGSVLRSNAALCVDLDSDGRPTARLKVLYAVRKQFDDALRYRRSLEVYEEELAEYTRQLKEKTEKKSTAKKTPAPSAAEEKKQEAPGSKPPTKPASTSSEPKKPQRPTRNFKAEIVLQALDCEMPVRFRAHRSSDILNALQLAESYSLDVILEGATEAYLVAEEIAKANAWVVLGRMDRGPYPRQAPYHRASRESGAVLQAANVAWIAGSGGEADARARFLAWNAQLAAVSAPSRSPLRIITAEASAMLGVQNRIGRLRPGMLADLVLWRGDPLDPVARVQRVYLGGQLTFEADP